MLAIISTVSIQVFSRGSVSPLSSAPPVRTTGPTRALSIPKTYRRTVAIG